MINLGLSDADHRAFEEALRHSHRIRVLVRMHDRDERIISTWHDHIVSGSVQVDSTRKPTRTLTLTMIQPDAAPAWLPDAPGDGALSAFANNYLSVVYAVWVPGLSTGPGWVRVPVFWGPISGLDKDGAQVTVQANGKESLGLEPAVQWKPLTLNKGLHRVTAMRRILLSMGERRGNLPPLRFRLKQPRSLGRHAEPWNMVRLIAGSMNRQVFYDGRGRVQLRVRPNNRAWQFAPGENGTLLSRPKLSYDTADTRNIVEVLGPESRGSPKRVRAVARPGAAHPLSPENLGRNGEPRWLVHSSQNSDVSNQRQAQQKADEVLADKLRVQVSAEFESLPIPHLEEEDLVAVVADGVGIGFRLRSFTLPLTSDESMSVGFNKRVQWRRRRRR